MYYYSNNYTKYIEKLKQEKSKVAFKRLVENSQEHKNPDIRIQDTFSTKNNNTSIKEESTISNKNTQAVFYDTEIADKNSISVENEESDFSRKQLNNLSSEKTTSLSIKEADKISIEKNFEGSEYNKVAIESEFDNDKSHIKISNDENVSNKVGKNLKTENAASDKSNSDLHIENIIDDKSKNNIAHDESASSKENNNVKQEAIDSSKEPKNIGKKEFSTKKISDIIYDIKKEKKREDEFANTIINPKKQEVTNLNRQYQFPLVDPKDRESMKYESNARRYEYYPAGSYDEINAIQYNAISDAFDAISNESNWISPGKIAVNKLRIATDIVDMVNLAGPATNIKTVYSINEIRKNLKADDVYLWSGKNVDSKPWKHESYNISKEIKADEKSNPLSDKEDDPKEHGIRTSVETYGGAISDVLFTADLTTEERSDDFNKLTDEELSTERKDDDPKEHGIRTSVETYGGAISDVLFTADLTTEERSDDFNKLTDEELSTERKDETKEIKPRKDSQDGEDFTNVFDNIEPKENKIFSFTYGQNPSVTKPMSDVKNIAVSSEGEENRWYDYPNSLGRIYVMPPNYELATNTTDVNTNQVFSIPLQNNITFEQISRAATWTAISFFGRIGDVQQYSKTNNLDAISITTKYFVEDNKDPKNEFTISKLQDIEMKYRSLVLPASETTTYKNDKTNKGYYYFTRPPIINVVLGNPKFIGVSNGKFESGLDPKSIEGGRNNNIPYHNLFTDIFTTVDENGNYVNDIFYKNFVVTNVTIDKNLNDYSYYVENNNGSIKDGSSGWNYYDTNGFTVTLTILEIDENYLGSLPSFTNYENTLKSRGGI